MPRTRSLTEAEQSNAMARLLVEQTIKELNLTSLREGRARIFAPTVIRFDGEHWWLMNRQETGWSSYARRFNTLHEIARAYALTFTAFGHDRWSLIVNVEPRGANDVLMPLL